MHDLVRTYVQEREPDKRRNMIIMQNGTNTKFKKINPKLLEIEKARTQELTSREFQIQRGSSGIWSPKNYPLFSSD